MKSHVKILCINSFSKICKYIRIYLKQISNIQKRTYYLKEHFCIHMCLKSVVRIQNMYFWWTLIHIYYLSSVLNCVQFKKSHHINQTFNKNGGGLERRHWISSRKIGSNSPILSSWRGPYRKNNCSLWCNYTYQGCKGIKSNNLIKFECNCTNILILLYSELPNAKNTRKYLLLKIWPLFHWKINWF